MKKGWIADNNLIPHKLVAKGTDVSLKIKPFGCWNITDKNQLKVCNLLILSSFLAIHVSTYVNKVQTIVYNSIYFLFMNYLDSTVARYKAF